ncbi:MAG: helix-turn-helix domain-containing protein, partial [Lachnospiraceae bacterium]|nr:helix-turn-helix domain-containing protein [Lachnospiraceae bacterium]
MPTERCAMTIEEMKIMKAGLGLSNEDLARFSGVPFSTIQKIFSGKTPSPRLSTILALEEGLETASRNRKYLDRSMFAEAEVSYSAEEKKGYTLDDYYALPEERRVELIDGEFYDMAAPSVTHQIILGELYLRFRACVDAYDGDCRVLLSPCDV